MATLAEAEQHRAAVEDVVTVAVAELVAEWPSLPTDDPLALGGPLADLLAALVDDFGLMTASLGAEWYDELRARTNAPGVYQAVLPPALPEGRITSSAEWASSASWIDTDKALRDSAAILDRLLAERDRDAIEINVERDPASPRYARYASAGACAFCALNATRGPVYRTEAAAGSKYHDHCHCIAVPVWSASDYEEAPYVADWRTAYYDATRALGGASDTSAILAHMRQTVGLR